VVKTVVDDELLFEGLGMSLKWVVIIPGCRPTLQMFLKLLLLMKMASDVFATQNI
jgi:hypothetical protein